MGKYYKYINTLFVVTPMTLLGLGAKITDKAPAMTTKEVAMFSGLKQDFDISKARLELGFHPKPTKEALEEALLYMWENKEQILRE